MTYILTPHFNVGVGKGNSLQKNAVGMVHNRAVHGMYPVPPALERGEGSSPHPRFENRGYDVGRAYRHWHVSRVACLLHPD